ncbi:hypothetical protein KIPB_002859 [Kipferlia bialata]|uniref:Big-1 domain-containing protein n=1 Tax=Kipferlia bialata TaxID=797122 RepID=A0A9K3CSZ2_9EUKA|nr:hypothetical protein KIPB_002859 [Kipferlia bialata]|eukprot:g2859.t1
MASKGGFAGLFLRCSASAFYVVGDTISRCEQHLGISSPLHLAVNLGAEPQAPETLMAQWRQVDTASLSLSADAPALFGTSLGLTKTGTGVALAVTAPGVLEADGGAEAGGAVYVYDVQDTDSAALPSLSLAATIPCPLTPPVRMNESDRETGRSYTKPLPLAVRPSLIAIADHQCQTTRGLGAVQVMHLSEGVWAHNATLFPRKQSQDLVFATDVAIDYSSTHIAASTRLINSNLYRDPTVVQAAYVYTVSTDGVCVEESSHRFPEQDEYPLDSFTSCRYSVALSDTLLIIGSPDMMKWDSNYGKVAVYGRQSPSDEWVLLGMPGVESKSPDGAFDVAITRVDNALSQWDGLDIVVASSPHAANEDNAPNICVWSEVATWFGDAYFDADQWFKADGPSVAFDGVTIVTGGYEASGSITSIESGPSYLRVSSATVTVTNDVSNTLSCTIEMDPALGSATYVENTIQAIWSVSTGEVSAVSSLYGSIYFDDSRDYGLYSLSISGEADVRLQPGESFGMVVKVFQETLYQDWGHRDGTGWYPDSTHLKYYGGDAYDRVVVPITVVAPSKAPTTASVSPYLLSPTTDTVYVAVMNGSNIGIIPTSEAPLSVTVTGVDGEAVSLPCTWDASTVTSTFAASSLPASALTVGDHSLSVTATYDETDTDFDLTLTVFTDATPTGLIVSQMVAETWTDIALTVSTSGNWAAALVSDMLRYNSALHMYYRRSQYEPFEYQYMLIDDDSDIFEDPFMPPTVEMDGEWMVRSSFNDIVETDAGHTFTASMVFYHLDVSTQMWSETQSIPVTAAGTLAFDWETWDAAGVQFYYGKPGFLPVRLMGGTAVVTTFATADGKGSAHVFTLDRETDTWAYTQTLVPDVLVEGEVFGIVPSIDVSEDRIAVSTFTANTGVQPDTVNAAYEFERDPDTGEWLQESIVPGVTSGWTDDHGYLFFVAIGGDTVVISSQNEYVRTISGVEEPECDGCWAEPFDDEIYGRTRIYSRVPGTGSSKYSYSLEVVIEGHNNGGDSSGQQNIVTQDYVAVMDSGYTRDPKWGEDSVENSGQIEVYRHDSSGSGWTLDATLVPTADADLLGWGQSFAVNGVTGDYELTTLDFYFGEEGYPMISMITILPVPAPLQMVSCPTSIAEGSNDITVSVVDADGSPLSDLAVTLLVTETEAGVETATTHTLTATETAGTYSVQGVTVRDVDTSASITASLGGTVAATVSHFTVSSDDPVTATRILGVTFASTTITSATIDPILLAAGTVHFDVLNGRDASMPGLTGVSITLPGGTAADAVWDEDAEYYTATLVGSIALGDHTASITVADPDFASASFTAPCHVYGTLASVAVSPTTGGTLAAGAGIDISISLLDPSGATLPSMEDYTCYVSAIADAGVDHINSGYGTPVFAEWDVTDSVYTVTSTPVSIDGEAVDVLAQCLVVGSETLDSASASIPVTVTPEVISAQDCVVSLTTNDSAVEWSEESVAAGDGFVVSVALHDTYMNDLSSGEVSVSITLGDTTVLPLPVTFNSDLTVFEASSLSSFDTLAQAVSVSVTADTLDLGTYSFGITANPTPDASQSIQTIPTEAAAGADISVSWVPKDQFGNLITQYESVTCAFVRESATRGTLDLSTSSDPDEYIGSAIPATTVAGASIPVFLVGRIGTSLYSEEHSITITAGAADTWSVGESAVLKVGVEAAVTASVTDQYGNLLTDTSNPLKVNLSDSEGSATTCTYPVDHWVCAVTYSESDPQAVATLYGWQNSQAIGSYTVRVVGDAPDASASTVTPDSAVMGATVLASVQLEAASGMLVVYEPDHPTVTLAWEGDTASVEGVYSSTSKMWLASLTAPTDAASSQNLEVSVNGALFKSHPVTMEDRTPSAAESVVSPALCVVSESQGFSINLSNAGGVTIIDTALTVTLKWSDSDAVYTAGLSTDSGAYSSIILASDVEGARELEVYVDGTLFLTHTVTQYQPPEAAVGEAVEVSGKDADSGYGDVVVMGDGWTIISAPLNGEDDTGTVYIMKKAGGSWSEFAALEPQTTATDGHYGHAMCLSSEDGGDTILYVGQPGREAVDVWQFNPSVYQWEAKGSLQATNGYFGDGFGSILACNSDRVLVGAPYSYNLLVPNTGSAYVFAKDSGTGAYTQEARFESATPEENAMFGSGLGLAGDMAAATTGGDATVAGVTVVLQYDAGLARWETASEIPYGGGDIVLDTELLGVADPDLDGGFGIYTAATGWGALSSPPATSSGKMMGVKESETDAVSLALGGGTLVVAKTNNSEGTGTLTVFTKNADTGGFVEGAPIEVAGTPETVAVDESGNLLVGKSGSDSAGTEVTAFNLASPTALVLVDSPDTYEQGTAGVAVKYYFLDAQSASIAISEGDWVTMSVADGAAVTGAVSAAKEYYTSLIDIPESVGRTALEVDTGNGVLPGAILVAAGPPDATESTLTAGSAVAGVSADFSVTLKSSYGDVVYAAHDVTVTWTYDTPAGTRTSVSGTGTINDTTGVYTVSLTAGPVAKATSVEVFVDTVSLFTDTTVSIVHAAPDASESSISVADSATLKVGDTAAVTASLLDEFTNVCDTADTVTIKFDGIDYPAVWQPSSQTYTASCLVLRAGSQTVSVYTGTTLVKSTSVTPAAVMVPDASTSEITVAGTVVADNTASFSVVLKESGGTTILDEHTVTLKWTYALNHGDPATTIVTSPTIFNSSTGVYTCSLQAGFVAGSYTLEAVVDSVSLVSRSVTIVADSPMPDMCTLAVAGSDSLMVGDTAVVSASLQDIYGNTCDNANAVSVTFDGTVYPAEWESASQTYTASCTLVSEGTKTVSVSSGGSEIKSISVRVAVAPTVPVDPEAPNDFPWPLVIGVTCLAVVGVVGICWCVRGKAETVSETQAVSLKEKDFPPLFFPTETEGAAPTPSNADDGLPEYSSQCDDGEDKPLAVRVQEDWHVVVPVPVIVMPVADAELQPEPTEGGNGEGEQEGGDACGEGVGEEPAPCTLLSANHPVSVAVPDLS